MAQGDAARFDSEGDGLELLTTSLFDAAWTVFCRARVVVDRNGFSTFFEIGDGTTSAYYQVGSNSSGLEMDVHTSGGAGDVAPDNAYSATVGSWFDFCVTRSGTVTKAYAGTVGDALDVSTNGDACTASAAHRLFLGFSESWAGEWFNGDVGGVKVWNVALSQAEVVAERGYYRAVRTPGLIGEYLMDGSSLADLSAANNDLTQRTSIPATVAGPSVPYQLTGPPVTGSSLFFLTGQ